MINNAVTIIIKSPDSAFCILEAIYCPSNLEKCDIGCVIPIRVKGKEMIFLTESVALPYSCRTVLGLLDWKLSSFLTSNKQWLIQRRAGSSNWRNRSEMWVLKKLQQQEEEDYWSPTIWILLILYFSYWGFYWKKYLKEQHKICSLEKSAVSLR